MSLRTVCDKPTRGGVICGAFVETPLTVTVGSKTYDLELCDEHQRPILDMVEAFGHRATQRRTTRRPALASSNGAAPTNGKAPRSSLNGHSTGRRRRRKVSDAEVRAWALEKGVQVNPTGRVPNAVKDQFAAAN